MSLDSVQETLTPFMAGESPHLQRYNKLQDLMKEKGIEHLLIEDPLDIYYLTGAYFSAGSFLAHQSGKPDFMVDSRYYDALQPGYWRAFLLDKGFWTRFWQRNSVKALAFDPDKTTYSRFQELCDQTLSFNVRLDPQKGIMSRIQRVKDMSQLKKMQDAGHLASKAFDYVCEHLKEGITERQVARMIRMYFVERGADISFEPIIAFGDHNAIPHHSASDRELKNGHLVMMDLGAKLDHYCSDMTRTFFFKEVSSEELSQLWHTTYEAYELACDMLRPGLSCCQLDRSIREFFKKKDLEERFTHSLGHGIGLRVHESPRIRSDAQADYQLEVGSIITIEPGLYLPNVGGVRLENTLAITPNGAQVLTPGLFQLVI